jgi:hypothetical protein
MGSRSSRCTLFRPRRHPRDGILAEGEWAGAAVATDFVQFEPRPGEPSRFRTEVLLLYDLEHLYIAFRVWHPAADGPTHPARRRSGS